MMTTKFKTDEQYIAKLRKIADDLDITGNRRPIKFKQKMLKNRGFVNVFSAFPSTDGLEPKNPLIVALGDSVTAGHFEFNFPDADSFFKKIENEGVKADDVLEMIDARKSYVDVFRSLLIDKYQQTSVSIINSGIAGDTVTGMLKRLQRDVIRYAPDLVLIHASLNWGEEHGDDNKYRRTLLEIVQKIKLNLDTEIVLITPNFSLNETNPVSSLSNRVKAMREIAEQEETCIVDIYTIWENYSAEGNDILPLLANGLNHPSEQVHAFHAEMLMRLFD